MFDSMHSVFQINCCELPCWIGVCRRRSCRRSRRQAASEGIGGAARPCIDPIAALPCDVIRHGQRAQVAWGKADGRPA